MAWATTADVLSLTGQTVTDAQIGYAQAIVELFADVVQDSDANLPTRDLRYLNRAVVYQVVWMGHQVLAQVFGNADVADQDLDDDRVNYRHTEARILAPLALRCIQRLSWHRPGTIRTSAETKMSLGAYIEAWLRDQEPDQEWKPLPA